MPSPAPTTSPAETELKLALPANAMRALRAHPLLGLKNASRLRLRNIYYDTPDLALMAARVAVRERFVGRRCLLTVKTAGTSQGGLSSRGEWEGPTRSGQFDFDDLVTDSALAQQLSGLAWQLIPVFETHFVRHVWQVRFADADIEVALDDGEVITGGPGKSGKSRVLRESIGELELELKSGAPEALYRFALALMGDKIALWPEDRSKAERGLALYTGKKVQPTKAAVKAWPGQTDSQAAFCAVALQEMAQLGANCQGVRMAAHANERIGAQALPDPEYVHQIRVSIRRLRTALGVFGDALPKPAQKAAASWREAWGEAAAALGAAREWDVLLTDWAPLWREHEAVRALPPHARQAMERWAANRRVAATQTAISHLDSPVFARLTLEFLLWIHEQQTAKQKRPQPIARWAGKSIARQERRLHQLLKKGLSAEAPERHVWRLKIKKIRYAIEQLRGALPKRQRQGLPLLARAQTHLGMLNDLRIAREMLTDAPSAGRAAWWLAIDDHERDGLGGLPHLSRALRKHAPS
ncbi:CHAD domain-containing protein [Hydrogenophaga sp. 5NK40-0174]|uniref:CYTH and CHAD domain-containing protein n=1 Tax=Hydrogenophaga sp. 5NK40-0174 TaxID=3127649 RepID=UPI003102E6C8